MLAEFLLMLPLHLRHGSHGQTLRSPLSKILLNIKLDIIFLEKLLTMYFGHVFVQN